MIEKESGVSVYDANGPVDTMIELCLEKARLIPELPIVDEHGQPNCTNPILDRHNEYIDAYSSWLLTSEGRLASPFERAVINKVILRHKDGLVAQAQFKQTQDIKAQAPGMAMQEQIANQQKQQSAAEMAQSDQQSKQDMVTQALGEQALKQSDREHQAQVDMATKEHDARIQADLETHRTALRLAAQSEGGNNAGKE